MKLFIMAARVYRETVKHYGKKDVPYRRIVEVYWHMYDPNNEELLDRVCLSVHALLGSYSDVMHI